MKKESKVRNDFCPLLFACAAGQQKLCLSSEIVSEESWMMLERYDKYKPNFSFNEKIKAAT